MKKIILITTLILTILFLFGCSDSIGKDSPTTSAPATEKATEKIAEKYADSKFIGKWYNAYSSDDVADFVLKADGTAVYKGKTKGKWTENGEEIVIKMKIDGKSREMKAYFIIAGDGFSCRATPENQHYLDDGEGELQLEIMLTKDTCIDCVKKQPKK